MEEIMSKRIRQLIGIASAVITYYILHEGAHFLYAICTGVFKEINFMGIGVQIDVYVEKMTNTQLGIFFLVGPIATLITAYGLVLLTGRICRSRSKVFKACMYYITIAMLLLDPLYLSVLCGFFGGGDMNGIKLLFPELYARMGFGVLLILNTVLFWKRILPTYTKAFRNTDNE